MWTFRLLMRTCLRCLLYLGSYNLGLLAKPLNSAYYDTKDRAERQHGFRIYLPPF